MTPDHQSIALALHLGAQWRERHGCKFLTFVPELLGKRKNTAPFSYGAREISDATYNELPDPGCPLYIASDIPNYPESLDAMRVVEAKVVEAQKHTIDWNVYATHLQKYWVEGELHPSASARLHALLLTLNLYRP